MPLLYLEAGDYIAIIIIVLLLLLIYLVSSAPLVGEHEYPEKKEVKGHSLHSRENPRC